MFELPIKFIIIYFIRLAAAELSSLKPALEGAGCRLIGVGLEPLGMEEFIQGGYFTGGELSGELFFWGEFWLFFSLVTTGL